MADSPFATPHSKTPGVIVTPPSMIHESIKRSVDQALATIPEGKRGALLAVATRDGINVAVAHKTDDGWTVGAWIGKDWHRNGIDAGVIVGKTWD